MKLTVITIGIIILAVGLVETIAGFSAPPFIIDTIARIPTFGLSRTIITIGGVIITLIGIRV